MKQPERAVLETIWLCPQDKTAVTSDNDAETCPTCGQIMQNIGWVESVKNNSLT